MIFTDLGWCILPSEFWEWFHWQYGGKYCAKKTKFAKVLLEEKTPRKITNNSSKLPSLEKPANSSKCQVACYNLYFVWNCWLSLAIKTRVYIHTWCIVSFLQGFKMSYSFSLQYHDLLDKTSVPHSSCTNNIARICFLVNSVSVAVIQWLWFRNVHNL